MELHLHFDHPAQYAVLRSWIGRTTEFHRGVTLHLSSSSPAWALSFGTTCLLEWTFPTLELLLRWIEFSGAFFTLISPHHNTRFQSWSTQAKCHCFPKPSLYRQIRLHAKEHSMFKGSAAIGKLRPLEHKWNKVFNSPGPWILEIPTNRLRHSSHTYFTRFPFLCSDIFSRCSPALPDVRIPLPNPPLHHDDPFARLFMVE